MYGRKKSLIVGMCLQLLSAFYALAVHLRHTLYRLRVARQRSLELNVISVGNITLGGTGKTPAVIQIVGLLQRNRKRPAVISRGYGRKDRSGIVVVSDGEKVLVDTETGGDEPVLIGSVLPEVPVVVGSDKCQAAVFAKQRFDIDTVVLDDGFQHLRLKRDLDIVLVDAADPFGNGKLFPAGILREPLTALKRAQVVLITGEDRATDLAKLKGIIGRMTEARIFTSRQEPTDIIDIITGDVMPLSALRGTTVLAFSGIARPESLAMLLRALGAEIRAMIAYPDHYAYNGSDLAALRQKAAAENIRMMITTEKDAVRLKQLNPDGIRALRIQLKVLENREWEEVLLQGI